MLVKTLILAKLPDRGECVATYGEKTCTTPIWVRNSKAGAISLKFTNGCLIEVAAGLSKKFIEVLHQQR